MNEVRVNSEIKEAISSLSCDEIGEVLYDLEKEHYEERPVSIREFVSGKEFLGPIFGNEFYPFWLSQLERIYPNPFYSTCFEIIASLPIGAGKTVSAVTSVLYDIYKLLCLKDPSSYWKRDMKGVTIVFVMFSASKSLAEDVNWSTFEGMIDTSPWFRKKCPLPSRGKLRSDMSVNLAKGINLDLGSGSVHALGKAVFGGILDEANFQRVKSQQAEESYLTILRRMESRFMQMGGSIPGKLWLLSSPKYSTDFLSRRIEEAKDTERTLLIKETPIWEVKHHLRESLYCGKSFRVYVGSTNRDPSILSEGESVSKEDEKRVFEVPVEYSESFKKDLMASIRDIIGVTTTGSSDLFRSSAMVYQVSVIPNRFTSEEIVLDLYNKEESLVSFTDVEYMRSPMNVECSRFLHLDNAIKRDRLGLAACYAKVDREVIYAEEDMSKMTRKYFIDWVLCVKCKPNQEIPIYKVRNFILFLKKIGYPIHVVTADTFQSMDTIQQLKIEGLNTAFVSVDRDREPYLALRGEINRGGILLPKHSILMNELIRLKDDGRKIDHLPMFSKDLGDAVCGSYWSCLNSSRVYGQKRVEERAKLDKLAAVKEMIMRNRDFQGIKEFLGA